MVFSNCFTSGEPDVRAFVRPFTLFLASVVFLIMQGCGLSHRKDPDTKEMEMIVTSQDLDKELFLCQSVKDVQNFLDKHSSLRAVYFSDFRQNPAQLSAQLFGILQNSNFQDFRLELDSLISDRDSVILRPLTEAFKRIKFYYPEFQPPKIQYMVTGFTGNDLYISDSLVVIGLDYFGGPTARFRPDVYKYQLSRYSSEYIVPSIIFFMADRYNKTRRDDKTLLADMIGYGKNYVFTQQILPEVPTSKILDFSDNQLKRIYNSQADIWSYFIAGKLLYEKTDRIKEKYTGQRPFTPEIGDKVPGGIGRWIGWRIVDMYWKQHPEVTLPELMQMDQAVNLLEDSGYSGQKDKEE
jgi:hypothetical protein